MEQLDAIPHLRKAVGGSYLGERIPWVPTKRRIILVLDEVLGTEEVWSSIPLVWEVFGERYKRLGFDNPHKLAV